MSNDVLIKNLIDLLGFKIKDADAFRNLIKELAVEKIKEANSIDIAKDKLDDIIDFEADKKNIIFKNLTRDFEYINCRFISKNKDFIKSTLELEEEIFTEKDHENAFKLDVLEKITELTDGFDTYGYTIAFVVWTCKGFSGLINKRQNNLSHSTYKNNSKKVITAKRIKEPLVKKEFKREVYSELIRGFEENNSENYWERCIIRDNRLEYDKIIKYLKKELIKL